MDQFAQISSAAHEGDFGRNNRSEPSLPCVRAGNYKKGRVTWNGLRLAIETPQGQRRTGKATGEPWSVICQAHYGYLEATRGADGDPLDVFIGPWPESNIAYVVNQAKGDDSGFDEHKILLCFPDADSAITAYRNSYQQPRPTEMGVVTCSIDQLKWWLKYGNHAVPLTANQLPFDGTAAMNDVTWDSTANPVGMTVSALLYAMRRTDASDHLLLDAVTVDDVVEDSDGETVLDAIVVPLNRLERKLGQMQVIMRAAGKDVKPVALQITPPFKQKGTTNVAGIIEMSDGQSVTIYFHNPDATPNRLTPDDEMVSWKWMLNKKDVTIVVAPERGQELNPREVARRVMRMVEANSARFQAANTKRAERMAAINAGKAEIDAMQKELETLNAEIETLQVRVDQKRATPPAVLQKGGENGDVADETKRSEPISSESAFQKFNRLALVAESFGAGKPQFYGVIQSDGVDLKDDFMPESDNKQMAMAMGQIAKEHGYAFVFQISVDKPDTPFRCLLVMYEDGRGIGSQFAATPAEAFDMLPVMTTLPAATFDPEPRMREVRDAMGRLGWNVSLGSLEMTASIDGSMYAIKAETTDASVRWLDTGSDRAWENDPSLSADQMAAKIDSEFRGAIEAAKAAISRPAWMDVDPTTEEGYAIVSEAGEEALLYHQDQLDNFFSKRYVAIRNALRVFGWADDGSRPMMSGPLKKGEYELVPRIQAVGPGRNVVGINYEIKGVLGYFMSDTLTHTPEEMAERINLGIPKAQKPDPVMVGAIAALEAAGWSRGDGSAIATKTFKSLDAEKQALAFLSDGDGDSRTLSFEFTSEGRNAAAADLALIPVTATSEEAMSLAAQAAERAEASIRDSYGVRRAGGEGGAETELVSAYDIAETFGTGKIAAAFKAYEANRESIEEPERDINEFASWAFDQKTPPLWDLPVKTIKGWSQEEFDAAEYALEDWNFHTENVLLKAKRVGSAEDVKEAKAILRDTRKSNLGISPELYAKRGDLSKRLFAKANSKPEPPGYKTYLQSVINGTTDLSDPAVADKLTALHEAHNGTPEFDEMFAKAADAYQAFMVEAAKKVLGN